VVQLYVDKIIDNLFKQKRDSVASNHFASDFVAHGAHFLVRHTRPEPSAGTGSLSLLQRRQTRKHGRNGKRIITTGAVNNIGKAAVEALAEGAKVAGLAISMERRRRCGGIGRRREVHRVVDVSREESVMDYQ